VFGMIEKSRCPICGKEYEITPEACKCGFDGVMFMPDFCTDTVRQKYEAQAKEQLFRIYKFAKQVYYGEVTYNKSELVTYVREDHIDIDEALETRGLAVVDPPKGALPTVAVEGLLAMRANVRALILNTNEAEYNMLDESPVEVLLLGADFKRFRDGGLWQSHPLRYLWVDGKSKHFEADDNVLFSKDRKRLHLYARSRPGDEYRVPESVKSLEPYSFFAPRYLKRLYLPRGIRVSEDAFGAHDSYWDRDGVLEKVRPEFEIIYY